MSVDGSIDPRLCAVQLELRVLRIFLHWIARTLGIIAIQASPLEQDKQPMLQASREHIIYNIAVSFPGLLTAERDHENDLPIATQPALGRPNITLFFRQRSEQPLRSGDPWRRGKHRLVGALLPLGFGHFDREQR